MRSKLVAADMATAAGIQTTICSGVRAQALRAVLARRARGHALSGARGALQLVQAVAEVREAGRAGRCSSTRARRARCATARASLLPVGIVDVLGEFEAGDAVEIVQAPASAEEQAHRAGEGDLQLLRAGAPPGRGMKSAPRARCCRDASEEAVHRDYLVID